MSQPDLWVQCNLRWRIRLGYNHKDANLQAKRIRDKSQGNNLSRKMAASEGTLTHDLQCSKLKLYQSGYQGSSTGLSSNLLYTCACMNLYHEPEEYNIIEGMNATVATHSWNKHKAQDHGGSQ